jgi:hypothetical protein
VSRLLVEPELVADGIGEDGERARAVADLGARRSRALVRRSIAFLDPRAADAAGVDEGDRSVGAAP